jgi:DNA replication factor GINS
MDLNELQSVQSRERQTDSLQQLRATFYQDAADYIQDLEAERDAAAERADDPWNAPEVGRLNDDIDTAKGTVEAIYDRRVGKIVKTASLAAADMPTDDEGLTEEEQALFDRLVAAIERNREGVFAILDGDDPPTDASDTRLTTDGESSPADGPGPGTGSGDVPPDLEEPDVGAADLMGGETTGDARSGGSDPRDAEPPVGRSGDTATEPSEAADPGQPVSDGGGADAGSTASPSPDVDRTMVRITDDVGRIYGVEGREYDLTTDDVVTLPEANVGPLLKQGAAERLD